MAEQTSGQGARGQGSRGNDPTTAATWAQLHRNGPQRVAVKGHDVKSGTGDVSHPRTSTRMGEASSHSSAARPDFVEVAKNESASLSPLPLRGTRPGQSGATGRRSLLFVLGLAWARRRAKAPWLALISSR
jgi:hypothetical protein